MATITYNSKMYNDISGGGVGTNGNDYFELTSNGMAGGLGDDVYIVGASSGAITENSGGGTDTVVSSVNYTLGANVENLTLTAGGLTGIGNGDANTFVGSSGSDTLIGLDGNDTYYIQNWTDQVVEGSGVGSGTDTIISTISYALTLAPNVENLTLTDGTGATIAVGNDSDNVLTGNALDNILNGLGGADTMIGGDGNDSYVVDNVGDVVIETGIRTMHNNNADTIYLWNVNNYTVADGVENLIFRSTNLSVNGNALDNTYTVIDATDRVVEAANGGNDTVVSSVTYTLDANVENLTLTGFAAINGTGNSGDNILRGNGGINVLTGLGGNDTYYVGAGDTVSEAAGPAGGIDTIVSNANYSLEAFSQNVENLTLIGAAYIGIGDAGSNTIVGNSFANILNGKGGDDRIVGGFGNDWLWGDGSDAARSAYGITAGADTFVFDTVLVGARNGGVDRIGDFHGAITGEGDRIELSSSIFTNVGASGTLAASEFASGAGMNTSSGTAHIIYDTTSGTLYYDADAGGSGGSVAFASLDNLATLSNSDFVVA
jgi:Ca2+-binding RTX toxin-like protein